MQPAKVTRNFPALEAHGSSALKEADSGKAGRGRKAKADRVPQPTELKVEADAAKLDPTSVIADANLCGGAVKPHTPAKVQPKLYTPLGVWPLLLCACLTIPLKLMSLLSVGPL